MESNKLIAEFMGRTITFDIVDNDTYRGEVTLSKGLIEEQIEPEISHFEDRYSVTPIAIEENLLYHKDWNWLMPVVEKIEFEHDCLVIINSPLQVIITNKDIGQRETPLLDEVFEIEVSDRGTKRDCLYKAIVEFIKQYNDEQNKT